MTAKPSKRPWTKPIIREDDRPQYTNAAPTTLGQVLGDQVRAVQAERQRRAELDDMGFRAVKAP